MNVFYDIVNFKTSLKNFKTSFLALKKNVCFNTNILNFNLKKLNNKTLKNSFAQKINSFTVLSYSEQKRISEKQAFISKKNHVNYEDKFANIKEKLVDSLQNEKLENNIFPKNTKIYVAVDENKNQILSSYPLSLYYRLNKKNILIKQFLENKKIDREFKFRFFDFLQQVIDNEELGKMLTIDFIDSYNNYSKNLNKKLFYKKFCLQKHRVINQNALILAFLDESDALVYRKEILKQNPLINNFPKLKRQYDKTISNYYVKIKPTTLDALKNSLKTSKTFEDFQKNKVYNTCIIIPKFFNYNVSKIFKIKKVSINFPLTMLTSTLLGNGFFGTPIYKTKEIPKRFFILNNKDSNVPLKYFKKPRFFVTLNKDEYLKLSKKDKRYLFFYEEERMIFIDNLNLKTIIREKNNNYLKQIEKIFLKIKKKSTKKKNFNLIKSFINKNHLKENLLEKTSYFIDKINKANINKI